VGHFRRSAASSEGQQHSSAHGPMQWLRRRRSGPFEFLGSGLGPTTAQQCQTEERPGEPVVRILDDKPPTRPFGVRRSALVEEPRRPGAPDIRGALRERRGLLRRHRRQSITIDCSPESRAEVAAQLGLCRIAGDCSADDLKGRRRLLGTQTRCQLKSRRRRVGALSQGGFELLPRALVVTGGKCSKTTYVRSGPRFVG